MELHLPLFRFGDDNGVLRQRHSRTALSARLRQKYAVPLRAAGRNIVDVENLAREALVENAWLQLKGNLRGDQIGLQGTKRPQGQRSKPGRHCQRYYRAGERQDADGKENPAAADAQRCERNDLAVSGHSPEPQQHADQRSHRHGEYKYGGEYAEKKLQNLHAGTAVPNKKLHQAHQLGHEKYKGKDDKPEKCVAENFADDIAVQDAHDGNGECNTDTTTFALRCPSAILRKAFDRRLWRSSKLQFQRIPAAASMPDGCPSNGCAPRLRRPRQACLRWSPV